MWCAVPAPNPQLPGARSGSTYRSTMRPGPVPETSNRWYEPSTPTLRNPSASRFARVRKTGGDRTDVGVAVAVIEMIDGDVPIHEDGLLDEPLPEDLGEELDILLRAAGTQRDVVNALNQALHGSSSSARIN